MNSTLTRLLKSKNYEKMSLDELIDEYIALYAKNAQSNFDDLLSELMIFLEKYDQNISPETVESLFASKIANASTSALPSSAVLIPLIYEKSMLEGISTPKVTAQFGAADERAINALEKRMMWVGNDSSTRTQEKLRAIFKDVYEGKYTHDELMQAMRDNFSHYTEMEVQKIKVAADFNLRQGRNIGTLSRAIEQGDTYVQVVAKIDDKTTNVCRSMHLRVIKVSTLKKQFDAIVNATSVEAAKAASNLSFSTIGVWTTTLPPNFGLPPYHMGCRTIIRQVSAVQAERMTLDEFGREYEIADSATYNKIKNKDDHLKASREKSVDNLLKDTLGSIAKEAVHKNDPTKRVIWGSNGFMGFLDKNGKIKSVYKPKDGIDDFYATVGEVYYDKTEQAFNTISQRVKKWLGL
ncbi:hypothetical protein [Sulfurospirillum cavolei]|uniref:hypothetical protein n=1 Tax=Sulfurospirillum cavolei TaxID=366522 RepID=UPI0005A6FF7F|nr:hypothetical protein [Sulfurospirillum cavolei]